MSYNIKTTEGRQIVAGNVDYSEIEELKAKLEIKKYTKSTSYGNIYYIKQGNVVFVQGHLTGLTTATHISLGTIESEYITNDEIIYTIMNNASPYETDGGIFVGPSGSLELYKPTGYRDIYITGTYIIG